MPQIEFRENKILKLTNVLARSVPNNELLNQNKQITMLINWVKTKGYQIIGPLIMYSKAMGVDAEGNPIIDSRVMFQLNTSNVSLESPYHFEKEMSIKNCLLARFNDVSENLQFATNKLMLYAYENGLELSGETYTVLMEQKDNKILADVFMPLKNN